MTADATEQAHWLLRDLDAAAAGQEPVTVAAHLRQGLSRLVRIHAGGPLPSTVDGHDLPAALADRLAHLRRPMTGLVAAAMYDADAARADDLYDLLLLRSNLQYAADDVRGTDADGVVDPEALAEMDEDVRAKLADFGPVTDPAPAGVPASHWWWSRAE